MLAVWVALVYLLWAIDTPEGAFVLTRGLLVTIMVLIAGRALNVWLDWILLRRPPDDAETEPGAEAESEPLPTLWVAGITAAPSSRPCLSPIRVDRPGLGRRCPGVAHRGRGPDGRHDRGPDLFP